MRIVVQPQIRADVVAEFYELYRLAFEPLRTLAAARQVLTAEEFAEEMADPRVDKYVAYDRDGRAVGLTTFTNDLSAVPWIEPAYFAALHPEPAARGAIFYLGFTLTHPEAQGGRVFALTVAPIIALLTEARGVVAYDICAHNDTVRHLGDGIARAIAAKAEATIAPVDAQTYYTAAFHGPRVRR